MCLLHLVFIIGLIYMKCVCFWNMSLRLFIQTKLNTCIQTKCKTSYNFDGKASLQFIKLCLCDNIGNKSVNILFYQLFKSHLNWRLLKVIFFNLSSRRLFRQFFFFFTFLSELHAQELLITLAITLKSLYVLIILHLSS